MKRPVYEEQSKSIRVNLGATAFASVTSRLEAGLSFTPP
jgi:hypothetical protein